MTDTNTLNCPDCGKRGWACRCHRRPPVANYSKLGNNRGPETMFGKVVPLAPLSEEAPERRATSMIWNGGDARPE